MTNQEEDAVVDQMRKDGMTWKEIGEALGKPYYSVKNRYFTSRMTPEQRDRRRLKKYINWREHRKEPDNYVVVPPAVVPPEVWAERNERLAQPLSLTAWFFGDPPLIRSALAQRGTAHV